ncbi:flagellin N-terminal helical domain-containing protein [Acetatifactor muris]|uniref:flagellin N-terminal helical domain-containing protein n=1 Tax=Acetatifactor muris TaxID=879566 RepID=UPI0023F4671B|nr:flagellin [Acetatifactor muris]
MVVQHNLTAMNSNRMLGITTGAQAKATEKLSSGYKINRAADDAAGLAISEKMRKQIRGLTQASANAQDGISAVQTAEGALTEVHDMLQRMNELAVKAANGTMSESDRAAIQSEVDQLVTEIDRVSNTTKFNETYLLKGSNGGTAGKLTYKLATAAMNSAGVASDINFDAKTGTASKAMTSMAPVALGAGAQLGDQTISSAISTVTNVAGKTITIGQTTYVFVSNTTKVDGAPASLSKLSVNAAVKEINDAGNDNLKAFSSMDAMMAEIKHKYGEDIKTVTSYTEGSTVKLKFEAFADVNDAIDLSLHVGADSSDDNKIAMNIAQMSARGLGVNGLDLSGDNDKKATAAIDVIADALQKVSDQRATLGAIQNRLEHTIANLDNVVENTTAAESQIRDTDMATQMVTYSNNQILAQAGQAMLAQSNQSNQGVLSLLG